MEKPTDKDLEDARPAWGRTCGYCCIVPIRVVIVLLGFFALICGYTNRVSLSLVITKLVVPINRTESSSKEEVCHKEEGSEEEYSNLGTFEWSEQLQGWVLGSFYIGYLITHVPVGIMADKYGAKWILGGGMFISALCTILSPVAIEYGEEWGLIATRIIMGAAQGAIFPAITTLLSYWVPAKERATLGTLCFSGVTAGTVISNLGSGMMLHSFHWSIVLYVYGIAAMCWFILNCLLCTSRPSEHPCIKPKEQAYLKEAIAEKTGKLPIPWKEMMLSKPMLALIICQFGHDWGYFVMISCLPKYMADVLQFSIRSNGIYTSLPFFAMWVSTILSGALADWLISSGKLTREVERKLFTMFGGVVPGALTVIASYSGCDRIAVVILLTLSMMTMGPYYAGQKLTPLDMSPTFSGTIMAISNGLGSVAGLISPPIIGLMTPNASLMEWRWVFWLGFAILTLSAIIFCIWGTADVQPYDASAGAKKEG